MSTRKLVVFITFAALAIFSLRFAADSDTFWHLAAGEQIVETKSIPIVDSFSHTKNGQPWQGAQSAWIMQSLLYLGFKYFGQVGLSILTAVFIISSYWIIYKILDGGEFLKAFSVIVCAASAGVFWAARPFLLSIFLSAAFLSILENFTRGKKNKLWVLPILMVLWVNGHGGFVIGLIFFGLYYLGELANWLSSKNTFATLKDWVTDAKSGRLGKLTVIGFFLLIATGINPAGINLLLYPFQNIGVQSVQIFIQEWQSPNFYRVEFWPFALILFLLIAILWASPKKISLTDFLLITIWGGMSFWAARNLPQFSLVALIMIVKYGKPVFENFGEKLNYFGLSTSNSHPLFNFLNWLIVGLICIVMVFKITELSTEEFQSAHINQNFPTEAIEYIKLSNPKSNMLNSYNWGGYLIWTLPEYPVYIDGRADLYQDELILEWYQFVTAQPGWESILADREIQTIFIEPTWPINFVLADEGWEILYQDSQAILWGID